jgi:hypothetical protein
VFFYIDWCRCEVLSTPHLFSVSFWKCKVLLCSLCITLSNFVTEWTHAEYAYFMPMSVSPIFLIRVLINFSILIVSVLTLHCSLLQFLSSDYSSWVEDRILQSTVSLLSVHLRSYCPYHEDETKLTLSSFHVEERAFHEKHNSVAGTQFKQLGSTQKQKWGSLWNYRKNNFWKSLLLFISTIVIIPSTFRNT